MTVDEQIAEYRAKGLQVIDRGPAKLPALLPAAKPGRTAKKKRPVALVRPMVDSGTGWWKFTIPVETASEANGRDWRKRSRRSDAAWRAVSKALGPYLCFLGHVSIAYHTFMRPVRVRFVRIGGHRLDRGNLPQSLKATEDAVAFILGADDGDPRWRASWDQEPGPGHVGVRVELDITEGGP